MGFYKFPITRVLLGHGLCIFFVALCRLSMLVSSRFRVAWGHEAINWCYVLKAGEIWGLGMGNTFNAIISLAYFRFIKKAWLADLKLYHISKDAAAWFIFVLLFLFCTASTAVCLSFTEGFLVDEGYCLAAGAIYKENKQYVLWLALCMCVPSVIAVFFFVVGTTYLTLFYRRFTTRESKSGLSSGLGFVLAHLKNIQIALKYLIISWFLTNSVDIFWLIYYPQSNNSSNDTEYYLASAQFTTIQNMTDFIVNLNFFILPRMGYSDGITEFLASCMTASAMVEESASSEHRLRTRRRTQVPIARVSICTDTTLGVELNESLLGTPSNFS